MSNWPYRRSPRNGELPGPVLHLQDRFTEEDLPTLRRLYYRAGAPRPPDEDGVRLLLAESDLALALRAEGPDGPILAFVRVLTDFTRDAVILDVLAESDGRISSDRLRADVVSAAVAHPLLREVARIRVDPALDRAPRPSLALAARRDPRRTIA